MNEIEMTLDNVRHMSMRDVALFWSATIAYSAGTCALCVFVTKLVAASARRIWKEIRK